MDDLKEIVKLASERYFWFDTIAFDKFLNVGLCDTRGGWVIGFASTQELLKHLKQ